MRERGKETERQIKRGRETERKAERGKGKIETEKERDISTGIHAKQKSGTAG